MQKRWRTAAAHVGALAAVLAFPSDALAAFPPLTSVSKLSAGADHACAIGSGGFAYCWGRGGSFFGALGRTTFGGVAAPVTNLPSVIDIAAGGAHSCAVTVGGDVKCWGENFSGQLGYGVSFTPSQLPIGVVGLGTPMTAVAAGATHSCALTAGGAAKCWGANFAGQLGNGLQLESNVPVDVIGIASGGTRVTAGGGHTCAVVAGAAKCWGQNDSGQLGDASQQFRLTPVQVQGMTASVSAIDAGAVSTCAVHAGAVRCWGSNAQGQLGDGTLASFQSVPVSVVGLSSGMIAVAVGNGHACAVKNTGQMYCWGSNNTGELGDNSFVSRNTPVEVTQLSGAAVGVAAGGGYSCALLVDGTVECFGANGQGQLGVGSLPARFAPVDGAVGAGPLVGIATGFEHSCGVSATGAVKCWGLNTYGQLGDGSRVDRIFPVDALIAGAAGVAAGRDHSCARANGGQAFCWGSNASGELGLGAQSPFVVTTPTQIPGLSGVADIDAGFRFSCAAAAGGAAKCWGSNSQGNLGDGTFFDRNAPVDVVNLPATVQTMATGTFHACALRDTGGIKCWGGNFSGMLGDGTDIGSTTPVDVTGLTIGARGVATGSSHTCAIAPDRSVRCWGDNGFAQLGDGTTVDSPFPVAVVGLGGPASALVTGGFHSCALRDDGVVRCWGANNFGQLGMAGPLVAWSAQPVDVALPALAVALAAGNAHTCAILATGTTKCWGASSAGQLGNGDGPVSGIARKAVMSNFATTLTLSSSANPVVHGALVTISVAVDGPGSPAGGTVTLSDGATILCFAGVTLGQARCTAALTPGTHTIVARYSGDEFHTEAVASITQVVQPIPGQNCAGFDDVAVTDPLCPSIDWLRNRHVTLGCSAFNYCPGDPVSRLAMAAFLNRTGTALSSQAETLAAGPLSVFVPLNFEAQMCGTTIPPADYPTRVYVDALVSFTADQAVDVEFRIATSGFSTQTAGTVLTTSVPAMQYTSARVFGSFDVAPERQTSFFVNVRRIGPGLDTLNVETCRLRTVVVNRNQSFVPYDPN